MFNWLINFIMPYNLHEESHIYIQIIVNLY